MLLSDFSALVFWLPYRAADFYRILTEPQHNMLKQQAALLATEGVDLVFTDEAVHEVARVAEEVMYLSHATGALHTSDLKLDRRGHWA